MAFPSQRADMPTDYRVKPGNDDESANASVHESERARLESAK